jgi:hypothetical protein
MTPLKQLEINLMEGALRDQWESLFPKAYNTDEAPSPSHRSEAMVFLGLVLAEVRRLEAENKKYGKSA